MLLLTFVAKMYHHHIRPTINNIVNGNIVCRQTDTYHTWATSFSGVDSNLLGRTQPLLQTGHTEHNLILPLFWLKLLCSGCWAFCWWVAVFRKYMKRNHKCKWNEMRFTAIFILASGLMNTFAAHFIRN